MVYTQSAGLRDREFAKFDEIQLGSKVGVNVIRPIERYIFTPANLTSAAGLLSVYSDYALNGEIKRIIVDTGNWGATGSLYIKQSGADISPKILQLISGTDAYGSEKPIYPGEYPSNTGMGAAINTAVQIGSPNAMVPLIVTGKVLIEGSGLGAGKSGLGIVIEYQ